MPPRIDIHSSMVTSFSSRWLALLGLCTIGLRLPAQQDTSRALRPTLDVYVDCEDWRACDFDYFRTEITFVNWVRDRQVADVHILVTTQQTGGGGREFTVTFLGLRAFAGLADTL